MPHLSDRILPGKWGVVHSGAHLFFVLSLILDPSAINGNFSPIPEQQLHTAGVHVEMAGSCIVLHVCVLSALRHSYSGLSCFLMIRSRTFFDGSKGFVLFFEEYKKSEPFSYRKKVRILLLWCTSRDSNPGPLIKRNQGATIVNPQNYADSLFLSFYRKFVFCICCILCTCYPLLHPLSSRSGVQKVCKNVQSQNQPLKTGIEFLCKAGKTAGFEPKTAAEISPVQTKHQMYINNYDSWQGFGRSNRHSFI